MKATAVLAAAIALAGTAFSPPSRAYTGDDPVLATGIASCYYKDIQAHIGPSGAITYKVYGSCSGADVSGQVAYSNGKFQESFIISNHGKISTLGYCDTDPWATAANCHDQLVQSTGAYDPALSSSAPLTLIGGGEGFHQAFLHATRPNPPGIPVNLASTYAPGRVTATWLAPDASGDRPFLGFLMQVRPQNAEGAAWTDIGTIPWHAALDYRLAGKVPPNPAVPAWEVRVCSTTALAASCAPPQTPAGAELATKVDSSSSATAAIFAGRPAPTVAFARVKTDTASPMTICEAAKSARARNSPAAPGLERQCAALQANAASAVSAATEAVSDRGAEAALLRSPAPKALGRVKAPAGTPAQPAGTICDMAASARAANRPTAAALQQRCDAERAASAAAAPPAPAGAPSAPVRAPQDLLIGRITYTQDGQRVTQATVGRPIAIACNYVVNAVTGPFVFPIQPWQGLILIGGSDPRTLWFQGDPRGGQHEASQLWTPAVAGNAPITCLLNPNFDTAEATAGNNRWTDTLVVVPGEEAAPAAAEMPAPAPPAEAAAPAPPADVDPPAPPAQGDPPQP